jgi:hypothetical protein
LLKFRTREGTSGHDKAATVKFIIDMLTSIIDNVMWTTLDEALGIGLVQK